MATLTLVATPDPPDFRRMPVWLDGPDGHFAYEFTLDETNRTIYRRRRSE